MLRRKLIKSKKRIRQRGRGWSDFTNWIKGAANTVNNWLKSSKITSTVANALKGANLGKISDIAGAVGEVAGKYGYGRRQRRLTYKR